MKSSRIFAFLIALAFSISAPLQVSAQLLQPAEDSIVRDPANSKTGSQFCVFCLFYGNGQSVPQPLNDQNKATAFHLARITVSSTMELLKQYTPLPYIKKMMDCIAKPDRFTFIKNGRRTSTNGYCMAAVRRVLNCTDLYEGNSSSAHAKNALFSLGSEGFYDDKSACHRPGVLRVYGGAKKGARCAPADGNKSGHIEILGLDFKYYHFNRQPQPKPINEIIGDNCRPLIQCLVSRKGAPRGSK